MTTLGAGSSSSASKSISEVSDEGTIMELLEPELEPELELVSLFARSSPSKPAWSMTCSWAGITLDEMSAIIK